MTQSSFIDELFSEIKGKKDDNPFEKYGFERNPFPGNEEEFFDFIYGQDEAKQIFLRRFKEFHQDRKINTLLIAADHRVGKTNFLRHYHHRLKEMWNDKKLLKEASFFPFYTRTYEYDFFFVYQQLIENLPEDIFKELFYSLNENPLSSDVVETDLIRALRNVNKSNPLFKEDDNRIYLFKRWLRGGYRSLNQSEKDDLGVKENIRNSPVGCRFLRDLLEIMQERKILNGLLLFFDEFERLVGPGLTRAQSDRYLNDIRNFISDFQKGAFFIFAITPASLEVLQRKNPAIPPRLGTEKQLRSLESEEEAIEFAQKYIEHFRKPSKQKKEDILTIDQISNVFLREKERESGKIRQGNFLARLREEVEKKLYKHL